MKLKIGNEWFEAKPDQPVMVMLSESDKHNIANMASHATRYAIFDDQDTTSAEEKLHWMAEV